jgi:hypothetical protein
VKIRFGLFFAPVRYIRPTSRLAKALSVPDDRAENGMVPVSTNDRLFCVESNGLIGQADLGHEGTVIPVYWMVLRVFSVGQDYVRLIVW